MHLQGIIIVSGVPRRRHTARLVMLWSTTITKIQITFCLTELNIAKQNKLANHTCAIYFHALHAHYEAVCQLRLSSGAPKSMVVMLE